MPPPVEPTVSRRHGSSWTPRRMAPSSSSSGSRSGGSAPPPVMPAVIKKEPTSPPPTRGRSSGALVIRDQPSSPSRGRKRKTSKKDAAAAAATSQLAEEEAKRAEDAAVAEAIARSLNDLVPSDNALPMDAALDCSRRDLERQEAEQQRRLLDLAAARQRVVRTAAPTVAPVPMPLIKLEESSDDELYRPTLPRATLARVQAVVGMARGDKDDNPIRGQTTEFKEWLEMLEAMDAEELKEYARENKDALTTEMNAAIKKVLQKKQPRKRKKRTAVYPILGAVLKFHKDDDDDPPPPGSGGVNAC
ncbi:hypothetical protein QYE76_002531 [Lolium multiflorum]|uniref:Uncharacterized protein n=1 Tax=Lolium multiflorum TaxID=4521 RepID=A0AAD8Q228_LOLMU|nr:hypothetical protein QYE76_037345 [Lolium multiflorum]KAK1628216.1 hypothetical protein QYE76_002531 [Lolium multiflorum]